MLRRSIEKGSKMKKGEDVTNVIHQIGSIQRSGNGSNHFLLTNKKGNYACLGSPNVSDFQGIFIFDTSSNNLFKTIQNISLEKKPNTIINHCGWIERITGKTQEHFFLTSNALIYEIERYAGDIKLLLDCKRLYDDSSQGRIYEHFEGPPIGIGQTHKVIYKKYADDARQHLLYERHILVAAVPLDGKIPVITTLGAWQTIDYPYDAVRGMPLTRHIYDALRISINAPARIIITSSHDPEKAEEKLRYVLEHQDAVLDAIQAYPSQRLAWAGEDVELAIATNALDMLVTKLKDDHRGIFAGLPWFFQFWMRDEALCLAAMLLQKQYGLAKEIIMRWLPHIAAGGYGALSGKDGPIGLRTADGPGLIALRTKDLLSALKEQGELKQYFSQEELRALYDAFESYSKHITFQHDLVINGAEETWMDTAPAGDGRAGTRIEIQACTLALYDAQIFLAKLLSLDAKKYVNAKNSLLVATKKWFFDKRGFLLDGFYPDGSSDHRARPNIFLAWYIYPSLLGREEWTRAFLNVLPALWQEWGAVTSIAINDPSFKPTHTGLDNKSYHHGDAWMYINNIVTLALFSTDPHRFQTYIDALMKSATQDLLFEGFIGHASEISDASSQKPAGCWAQAWSAATLIELLHKMRHEG